MDLKKRYLCLCKVVASCRKSKIYSQSVIRFCSLPKVSGLAIETTLLWHRCEWGFQEWIHEVTFFNFWHGHYVVMAGKKESPLYLPTNVILYLFWSISGLFFLFWS